MRSKSWISKNICSVGFNQSGISLFGVNYENKDLESTMKNTVIGQEVQTIHKQMEKEEL